MTTKEKNYFLFFAGIVGGFQLKILGTFYFIEIIAFLSFLFIPWRRYKENYQMRTLIKMSILWLIGAIVSDIYNDTLLEDALKGSFSIVFFILQIPFIYWSIVDNPQRWIYFVSGNSISILLNFYLIGSSDMDQEAFEIWQVYIWGSFFTTIASILFFRGKHRLSMIVFFLWGLYTLFNNSRNVFLTLSLTVVVLYMIDKYKTQNIIEKIRSFKRGMVPLFLAVMFGGVFVDVVYETLASSGSLGDKAYEKYILQKNSSGSILEGGRMETFMGVELVKRNPIIGYGSFAKDKGNEFIYSYALEHKIDIPNKDKDDFLPAHSHIVGYWVWHGILGGIFWMYILFLMWKNFKSGAFLYDSKMIALCVYYSISQLWSIMFSPFGKRTPILFFIVYLIVIYDYYKNDKYKIIELYE